MTSNELGFDDMWIELRGMQGGVCFAPMSMLLDYLGWYWYIYYSTDQTHASMMSSVFSN